MFKKILIANRAEIAIRITATCREMGIQTVAIFSEADRHARHVQEADQAFFVGPAPATQSYLQIATIIDVAQLSGAEAIHPGYGFLSENADFAAACEQAHITFIGPTASTMRLMGSKIAAKQLAQSVAVPTVPGYTGNSQQDDILYSEAQRIGFPLLIKASAGGGGKGMRSVYTTTTFLEQLAGARREALAAFGDATVFLERLIQQPRHIEIQILADTHGQIIHLGERECSIQRRHQKILEESPSSALTPALRATMGASAIRIAQAAHYVNAGTLEFMLDTDQRFYFLEMNTRLQVEHPVTELVTGLDLVRHQLLIASGAPLSLQQHEITQRGHAIEVRLYAENPAQDFLPSTGTITHFTQPVGPGVRLDSGIHNNSEITQYYDPLLAKLIVYAENRPATIARLQQALQHTAIFGVNTNLALLHTISQHPAFASGTTFTNFLTAQSLIPPPLQKHLPTEILLAAALSEIQPNIQPSFTQTHPSLSPWQTLGLWRMLGETRIITYTYQETTYKLSLQPSNTKPHTWHVQIDNQPAEEVSVILEAADALIILKRATLQTQAYIQLTKSTITVSFQGHLYQLQRRQPPDIATSAHTTGPSLRQKTLTAPMAGTIVKVQVQVGDIVAAHQVLMILTAMKMEHAITAPHEGTVQRVLYKEGDIVPGGATVLEIE